MRQISREKTAAWLDANGKKALAYICLALGFDEPMGYARFEEFSKTLQPGNTKILD